MSDVELARRRRARRRRSRARCAEHARSSRPARSPAGSRRPDAVDLPHEAQPTLERFAELRAPRRRRLDEAGARAGLVRELKAVGGDLRAVRLALTGAERGPELWTVVAYLPRDEALERARAGPAHLSTTGDRRRGAAIATRRYDRPMRLHDTLTDRARRAPRAARPRSGSTSAGRPSTSGPTSGTRGPTSSSPGSHGGCGRRDTRCGSSTTSRTSTTRSTRRRRARAPQRAAEASALVPRGRRPVRPRGGRRVPEGHRDDGRDRRPDRAARRRRARLCRSTATSTSGSRASRATGALGPAARPDRGAGAEPAQGGPTRLRALEGDQAGRGHVVGLAVGTRTPRVAHRVLGDGARTSSGSTFWIHGGGLDLVFPHHENERAQSQAAGHPFARVWMHNGMLRFTGEKMSKSVGNVETIRDVARALGARDGARSSSSRRTGASRSTSPTRRSLPPPRRPRRCGTRCGARSARAGDWERVRRCARGRLQHAGGARACCTSSRARAPSTSCGAGSTCSGWRRSARRDEAPTRGGGARGRPGRSPRRARLRRGGRAARRDRRAAGWAVGTSSSHPATRSSAAPVFLSHSRSE